MTFDEFKIKEFKGDALAKFLATLMICTDANKRISQRDIVAEVVSNFNFTDVAKKMGIKPHKEDGFEHPVKLDKRYANAYEARLFEVYEQGGFTKALKFFNDTAVANYYKKFHPKESV